MCQTTPLAKIRQLDQSASPTIRMSAFDAAAPPNQNETAPMVSTVELVECRSSHWMRGQFWPFIAMLTIVVYGPRLFVLVGSTRVPRQFVGDPGGPLVDVP